LVSLVIQIFFGGVADCAGAGMTAPTIEFDSSTLPTFNARDRFRDIF